MKSEKEIKKRLKEIESQPIFSSEDRGEWKGLVWSLDGSREMPWDRGNTFNKFGKGRQ
jgi:hypothetical protein